MLCLEAKDMSSLLGTYRLLSKVAILSVTRSLGFHFPVLDPKYFDFFGGPSCLYSSIIDGSSVVVLITESSNVD